MTSHSSPSWLTEGAPHVWRPYCQHHTAPPPLPVVAAHGSRLVLADHSELVCGIASWWTAAHGYNHPAIAAAVSKQLQHLSHVAFGGLANEPAYTLAKRIAGLLPAPLSRVFFVESGSVAVEVALKMALQSFHNQGQSHRRKVVCFDNAYHGDTFATMAMSDPVSGMHRAFQGLGVEVTHVPLPVPESDAFEQAFARIANEVAAVVVEPLVQCAGGMRFHDSQVLKRLRAACDHAQCLLVFDEIATGFFRTGSRFALDAAGVTPDIVTLGKALTGGTLPLAAAVATERVFEAFLSPHSAFALQHGPTYMGNALACAAAHASLDLFESRDSVGTVKRLEGMLRQRLQPLAERDNVIDVRVLGGIGVVEMRASTAPSSAAFAAHGAFVRPLRLPNSDVVYLAPPLVIDDRDFDQLLSAIERTL